MKRQTGIWLDKREASIIHLNEESIDVVNVHSKIDESHIGGGSRSKQPYGPMGVSSESKLLERKKHQANAFFQDIVQEVLSSDEVFILAQPR